MSTINNVFGNTIDSYDFDVSTNTFSITFKQSISSDQKLALDTLINIFVDSTVLSPTDVLQFKNVRAYKSSDQVMPTTINTVTEVLFRSTSTIDRLYYQMSASGKYIFIQKPGIYLIMCKVGAHLTAGSTAGTNSVIQWGLSYDDSRTEVVYITVPNTNTYTLHTNVNNMTDSTHVACILNVTSATGTYFRLTAKQTLGNTPLTIDNDQTSITIMSIPGASFYEGNMTTAQTLTTTFANVNLQSDRLVQYPFTHTVATPGVTVTQTGTVIVFGKTTVNKTAAADASQSRTILLLNGTQVVDSGTYSTVLSAANNKSTSHFMAMLAVNAGDIITMQARIEGGSALQLPAAESGITLIYMHPAVLNSMSSVYVTSDAPSSTPLSTSSYDVVYNKTPLSVPSNVITLSGSSAVATSNPGLYLVMLNLTVLNTSGSVRECGIYTTSSTDSGKTFYYMLGSLGVKQLHPNGKTTISNHALLSLPAGSRVKIQVSTNGTTADNITTTDTTQLTVVNFDAWSPDGLSEVFGDNFNVMTSIDDLIVSTASYYEKCRMTYYQIEAGVYRITTNISITTTATTTINVQIIDIHTNSGNTYTVYNKTIVHGAGTYYFSSTDYANISDGAHQLVLQLSSPNAVAYTAKNATIDSWRVI